MHVFAVTRQQHGAPEAALGNGTLDDRPLGAVANQHQARVRPARHDLRERTHEADVVLDGIEAADGQRHVRVAREPQRAPRRSRSEAPGAGPMSIPL